LQRRTVVSDRSGEMRRFVVALVVVLLVAGFVAFAHAEPGTQSELTAISGPGTGNVLVSPTAKDRPTFDVQVEVNVRDMPPNSTFTVQRRVDLQLDGVCTSTTWLTNGPITTSEGGAGAQHFEVARGAPFLSGVKFDVQFRVVGDGAELRSDCFTVTVK
jgi:hypothetical protein